MSTRGFLAVPPNVGTAFVTVPEAVPTFVGTTGVANACRTNMPAIRFKVRACKPKRQNSRQSAAEKP
jgi:hypothetical protein